MEKGLNRNQLKYMAIAAMLTDHIGMFFIPVTVPGGSLFRVVGRLTAPIMCYFISEGYFYTSSKQKYGLRLLLFAVISQFAYAFSHYNKLEVSDLNMILTLFLSFLVLVCYDQVNNPALKWSLIVLLMVMSCFCDWGVIAPLWVLAFWIDRGDRKKQAVSFSIVSAFVVAGDALFLFLKGLHWYGELWQLGLFLFLPFLFLYNGQKGKGGVFSKWVFYVFYPLHLVILGMIKYHVFPF